jgi:hypothetical protein
MHRTSLTELESQCQKPDHRRVGNWMARRISRPMALRVTRVVAPWGVSANAATLAAWGCGVAAAAAFGGGTVWGWLIGAVLLQAWYLLDHVDGQLARLRGTASLDGVQLDYLMHHTVNLLVPLGVGFGLFAREAEPLWLVGGLIWGGSLLLVTLQHDARYKAFTRRLKRVRGPLLVHGGGGGRPIPQPPVPRHPLRSPSLIIGISGPLGAAEINPPQNAQLQVGKADQDRTQDPGIGGRQAEAQVDVGLLPDRHGHHHGFLARSAERQ